MTGSTAPSLAEILAPVKHVLLDFDGPVCSVFAGLPAPEVAHRLRAELAAKGQPSPLEWETETDPLALLRRIVDKRPHLTAEADTILATLETEAAQSARPTPYAASLLKACTSSGRSVHIVSNNAGQAIQQYLDAHQLSGYVAAVFGRRPNDPASMKPNPQLLHDAMTAAAAQAAECIFIGDAVRDVQAGDAAGIRTIGYANKPGKREKLSETAAATIVDSMKEIAEALRDGSDLRTASE
ncbi:HAD family hydrolase [Streptomyces sp. HB2AG]|uniref:HAD family hydrolase n=1 Tax=Streptomyces sp. HB2AG TaxID=2983400 RepID=UPI0022AB277A|nr:HAD-IA family hydrolase [Streptomyces sp. HB2AG]MCZ2525065.1 HAD-IA family hydrolase [Streptomyces sp. HB2AG]